MLGFETQVLEVIMFIEYIQAAMHRAKYEILGDDEGFVGTIPGFKGLIAHGALLEDCREELCDVLQAWMLVRIEHGLRLPVIGRLDLNRNSAGKRRAKAGGRRGRKVA